MISFGALFQREESMKRLLEWKQRMLQSPLTRKSSRNPSRTQTPSIDTMSGDSPVPAATAIAAAIERKQSSGSGNQLAMQKLSTASAPSERHLHTQGKMT